MGTPADTEIILDSSAAYYLLLIVCNSTSISWKIGSFHISIVLELIGLGQDWSKILYRTRDNSEFIFFLSLSNVRCCTLKYMPFSFASFANTFCISWKFKRLLIYPSSRVVDDNWYFQHVFSALSMKYIWNTCSPSVTFQSPVVGWLWKRNVFTCTHGIPHNGRFGE